MKKIVMRGLATWLLVLGAYAPASATSIQIGTLSLEEVVPGDPSPVMFRIWNLLDLVALDSGMLSFSSMLLTLTPAAPAAASVESIPDLAGAELFDTVPSVTSFSAARLTGALTVPGGGPSFQLIDGSIFTLASSSFDVTLLPLAGASLVIGDVVEVWLNGAVTPPPAVVPEPTSWLFVASGVALTAIARRWRHASRR